MVRILTVNDVCDLIHQVGILPCFSAIIEQLRKDFSDWSSFEKRPRVASHFPHGVIELMPICNQENYAFKYVNGHPDNPKQDLLTVTAFGSYADVKSGYPLMISEMTLLTAMRTAATSALASKYLVTQSTPVMALIGTGSQGEFQVLAHHVALGTKHIQYFDIDSGAMDKFEKNLKSFDLTLERCKDARAAIEGADIITTATADKRQSKILLNDWIQGGVHINGIGGDCPGKTEIDLALLQRCKIVVEYLAQTKIEGEIQNLDYDSVYAELWELVTQVKPGRVSSQELTLFDSVGFALEDYSILKYFYEEASVRNIGKVMSIIPHLKDPKNLFSLI